MLEIHLCKPAIYELRILGGGKFECYKSVGRTTKKVGPSSVGESKREGGGHDFWLKFSWGDLEKIMSFHRALDFIFIFCTHFAPFFHYDFLFINSFSFIINNIFFPRKEKVESSLEILLYDFSISMQNTYNMNEEQRWLQTFFSNLILCTERTSYARDVSNEWIYLLY